MIIELVNILSYYKKEMFSNLAKTEMTTIHTHLAHILSKL